MKPLIAIAGAVFLTACDAGGGEGSQRSAPAEAPAGASGAGSADESPATPDRSPGTPQIFAVTGVSEGDVLNVRAEPRADAAQRGAFAPDARPIEVFETTETGEGRWGRVLHEGRPGWVNMAYLQEIEFERVGGSAIPAGLMCTGTEPFWGLEFFRQGAEYTDPEIGAPRTLALEAVTPAAARGAFPAAVSFSGGAWAVIERERCSDGMSSDDYEWSVLYFTRTERAPAFLTGCCRVEPD